MKTLVPTLLFSIFIGVPSLLSLVFFPALAPKTFLPAMFFIVLCFVIGVTVLQSVRQNISYAKFKVWIVLEAVENEQNLTPIHFFKLLADAFAIQANKKMPPLSFKVIAPGVLPGEILKLFSECDTIILIKFDDRLPFEKVKAKVKYYDAIPERPFCQIKIGTGWHDSSSPLLQIDLKQLVNPVKLRIEQFLNQEVVKKLGY